MSPRPWLAMTLAFSGLTALAACHPARIGEGRNHADKAVTVGDRLDCPQRQGALSRTDAASDGRSCAYTGPEGRRVTLQYLTLDGRPAGDALKVIESGLETKVPSAPGAPPAVSKTLSPPDWEADKAVHASAKADAEQARADEDPTDGDGEETVAVGHSGRGGRDRDRDHIHLDLPGLRIDTDNGDAHIRAFGQVIDADKGGHAVVSGGWNGKTHEIVATEGGVRMRYGFVGDKAVNTTFLLASDKAGPGGDRVAAYVARGPRAGPLVLATLTSTGGDTHSRQDKLDDEKALVDRNVHR